MSFNGMPGPNAPGPLNITTTVRPNGLGMDVPSYPPTGPSMDGQSRPVDSFQMKGGAPKPVKPLTFGQKLKEVGKGFGKSLLGVFSAQGLIVGGLLVGLGLLAPPLAGVLALGGALYGGFSFIKSIIHAQKHGWTKENCQDVGGKTFGLALGFVGMRLAGAAGTLGKGGSVADDFISLKTLKNVFTGKFSKVGDSAKAAWNDSIEGIATTTRNLFKGDIKVSGSEVKANAKEMRNNPVGAAMDVGGATFMGQALKKGGKEIGHVPTTAIMIDGAKPEKPKEDEKK